jgi:hypothetical protein
MRSFAITINIINGRMRKLLLVKEIYFEAFRNWSNIFMRRYFKAFSWFCFALLAIVIYAFVFRVYTGFGFSNF